MQPQSSLNMDVIRQALMRRGGGAGGGTLPAAAQTATGGVSPMGSPQTPQPGNPQPPVPSLGQLPTQVPQTGGQPGNQQLKAGQMANSPSFDPETRDLAKSLVQRLLKGL